MKVDKIVASASKERYFLKSVFPVRQSITHADLLGEPHSALTGFPRINLSSLTGHLLREYPLLLLTHEDFFPCGPAIIAITLSKE